MAKQQDITAFHKGETVVIDLAAKGRDGLTLPSAASYTARITFASTAGGVPVLEFAALPQVGLIDAAGAAWQFVLTAADLSALNEGVTYFYNLWTDNGSGDVLLQAYGEFKLNTSIEPS